MSTTTSTASGSPDDEYEFRTFPAALHSDGAATPESRDWLQAEAQGFHDSRLSEKGLDRTVSNMVADGRLLTGVYTSSTPASALGAAVPVATFATFEKSLAVGGAAPVPAHLISAVTVRPTHRRRGLLRRMMIGDLRRAVADGYAIAALTVSEATIYRRFGFGLGTWVHAISVVTDSRFRLLVTPGGSTELIDALQLPDVAPAVFARFHAAHPGSIDRQASYADTISGRATDKGEDDPSVRAAAHYDDSGAIDGYVSYRVTGTDDTERVIQVVDFVTATDDAYLGLWQLLASIDLTQRVTWDSAPADDPLRWALADWRLVTVTGHDDWLWLRVLDVVAAFEARGYVNDGELVLEVTDPLGYAAGRYRLQVSAGHATVTRLDPAAPGAADGAAASAADLVLDASTLGSLYLGGVDARTMHAAGHLDERTPGAVETLRRILTPVAPVYCLTHF